MCKLNILSFELYFNSDINFSEQRLHTGYVAIVTGGSAGIGFEVSRGLVSKNVHVVIGLFLFINIIYFCLIKTTQINHTLTKINFIVSHWKQLYHVL